MIGAIASGALLLLVCFSRSVRGGFSGPLGTYLGLLQIPLGIALLWLLALVVGWWTIAIFVAVSLVSGVLVIRATLGWWVIAQPMIGLGMVVLTAAAWALHLL